MDYRDSASTQESIKSYMAAFDQMVALCPRVEPSSNDFNGRAVLPRRYTPSSGFSFEALISNCTHIRASHDTLFDGGSPKIIRPRYNIWESRFFTVRGSIDFPYSIYAWECARVSYPEGFDENDEPIGKAVTTPAQMKDFAGTHFIVLDALQDKHWGLKDWRLKHEEIRYYLDHWASESVRDEYAKAFAKADEEVIKWEAAIKQIAGISIPV